MPTLKDIEEAYERIKNTVNKTSVFTSRSLDKKVEAKVFIKCENFQRAGAFKFRGVTNKLLQLSAEEKAKGVITHSSGNHAQALALASSILGIKSVIVMPKNTPKVKLDATREYGAKIVQCANSISAREEACNKLAKELGYVIIHPYDDEQIIAGAGTAALELIKKIGDFDYIFCPVGGGGLISGTSIATKGLCPNAKVIAVEPEKADDAYRSFKDRKLHLSSYPNTIADGLRTSLSKRTFKIIQENVDEIITVSEKEILEAMKFLWIRTKIVVEPSGAVSLAGLYKKVYDIRGKKIGVIISGGNVDLDDFFSRYNNLI